MQQNARDENSIRGEDSGKGGIRDHHRNFTELPSEGGSNGCVDENTGNKNKYTVPGISQNSPADEKGERTGNDGKGEISECSQNFSEIDDCPRNLTSGEKLLKYLNRVFSLEDRTYSHKKQGNRKFILTDSMAWLIVIAVDLLIFILLAYLLSRK